MTTLEICLMIAGFVAFIGSFFIIERLSAKELKEMSKYSSDEIGKIIEKELENSKVQVEEAFDEMLESVKEKAKREFEKIANEKIIAISEYSETVLDEINKNHKEVVFLYSMLCDKQEELKEIVASFQVKIEKEQLLEQPLPVLQERHEVPIMLEKEDNINNNQRILEFYQQGKPPVEIARELGLGLGEVKLVIDLFKGEK